MSDSSSNTTATIGAEESKTLGKLATAKHPLAVHGMAKKALSDSGDIPTGYCVTSAAVTAVRTESCDLRVALCQGDLCTMRKSVVRFSKPLEQAKGGDFECSLDARMAELRTEACTPDPTWLVRDPLAVLILAVCGLLAFGTLGVVDLVATLEGAPRLESTLGGIFGSTAAFATVVAASFWFSVVAHGVEAVIAVYYSHTVFGLGPGPTAVWGLLVFLVGYPIFSRLQELVAIEHRHAKSK